MVPTMQFTSNAEYYEEKYANKPTIPISDTSSIISWTNNQQKATIDLDNMPKAQDFLIESEDTNDFRNMLEKIYSSEIEAKGFDAEKFFIKGEKSDFVESHRMCIEMYASEKSSGSGYSNVMERPSDVAK